MTNESDLFVKRGSEWHRWEPHIHAPGTILNDRYGEADAWEQFLSAIEAATPVIRAIGLTDYCSIETYKRLRGAKNDGRLPSCDVIFPNVELRLDVGTKKGNQVNIHLLVDPNAENHVEELERFLGRLKFSAHEDEFACTPADLMRLGRKHDPKGTVADAAALATGTNQFKISRKELLDQHDAIRWARENILIGVAGGADGTSGVQEAADAALREEIEKGAHVIFAGSAKQREFWLGRGGQSVIAIRERYGSLKPCLWGCDAHELAKVAKPDENRLCWVKGIPNFDTLKQASIDPSRAFVGEEAPYWAAPSQVISEVEITGADWARTPRIQLNPGFVAIIGARGSGKTALADIIAAGCDAYDGLEERPSFLARASEYLSEATVELRWLDGGTSDARLGNPFSDAADAFPRARYLSQQFVEKICSIDGMPELVTEIERVIFEAHTESERDGTYDFEELLNLKASELRETRENEEVALADVSDQIGIEIEKFRQLVGIRRQVDDKTKLLKKYAADKKALMPKTPSKHADRLQEVEAAATKAQQNLRHFVNRQQALSAVNNEVANFRSNEAPQSLRGMKVRNKLSGLSDENWNPFLQKYSGDVDSIIKGKLNDAEKGAKSWRGVKPTKPVTDDGAFILPKADLANESLAVLEAEKERLQKLVATDAETRSRLAAITKRINDETILLESLTERLSDFEGAMNRAKALVIEREAGYGRVFDAILSEEAVLNDLYAPLMTQLTKAGGSLAKLSFSVSRVADFAAWAKRGEGDLFDLRGGPFKGIGSLAKVAGEKLLPAWESGTSAEIGAAMKAFREEYEEKLLANAPVPKTEQENYRAWARRFAQWLYSTDHITIRYGILYDGIDIRKLSPGTRGIVVLLLYLALDRNEVCPLIIDQPEENLDPKSIFDELVPLFEEAKLRRQVIMVTHNANLVVNANADQIIVAQIGSHTADGIPPISYVGGGIEEEAIRKQVSEILEGGKEAFKERARRLRISFDR